MFNTESTLNDGKFSSSSIFYLGWRLALPFFPLFFFLENSRKDVPESAIVQLTPGAFYTITSYFCFFFLVLQIFTAPNLKYLDEKIVKSAKDNKKLRYFFTGNFSFWLIIFYFPYLSGFLIPLSLDTLTNYSKKTLANFWVYSKVLSFEASILVGLVIFYQFPCFLSFFFIEEKKIQNFSRIWKKIIFYSFIIAAGITPSIDPITQIGCTFFTLVLYNSYSKVSQKKIKKKYLGSTFFA